MSDKKSDPPAARRREEAPEIEDAPRGEVMLYAFGNIEGAIANRFFEVMKSIMVVAMHVSPLLVGLILGLKSLWDSVTDPVMAYITDNTKSRWGRRRPYILIGGVTRIAMLVGVIAFFPTGGTLTNNIVLEGQKQATDAQKMAETVRGEAIELLALTARDKAVPLKEKELTKWEWLLSKIPLIGEEPPMLNLAEQVAGLREDADAAIEKANKALVGLAEDADEKEAEARMKREKAEKYAAKAEEALKQAETAGQRAAAAREMAERVLAGGSGKQREIVEAALLLAKAEEAEKKAAAARKQAAELQKQAAVPLALAEQEEKKAATAAKRVEDTKRAAEIAQQAKTISALALKGGISEREILEKLDDAIARAAAEANDEPAAEQVKPEKKKKKKGMWENIKEGFGAFTDPANYEQRNLVLYVMFAFLLFTTLTTVQSVPYYALGIELCPSYHGRTRVVVYRSVMDKVAGLVAPWVPAFCFMLWFTTALDGLFWVAVFACVIGIPSTILMVWFVKERQQVVIRKTAKLKLGFWPSIWYTLKNPHFLKIFSMYWFIGLSIGLFQQIGFYLNVYWVMGSALSGAVIGGLVASLAWFLGLVSLPLINWGCKRFQKHNVLRFALIWMAIGCALKWWAYYPGHPERQFIMPFFFSIGIGTFYTVLSTLMADVTDVDELNTGQRREGMFGAVMAFLIKMVGTFTPVAAGAVLVIAGFDPGLEYAQTEKTIFNMRLMYSFIPAAMLITGLCLLWRYPLTAERMGEIKAELKRRHAAEADAETAEGS